MASSRETETLQGPVHLRGVQVRQVLQAAGTAIDGGAVGQGAFADAGGRYVRRLDRAPGHGAGGGRRRSGRVIGTRPNVGWPGTVRYRVCLCWEVCWGTVRDWPSEAGMRWDMDETYGQVSGTIGNRMRSGGIVVALFPS